MNTRPLLKDLYQHTLPHAIQWRMIGALLGVPTNLLNIIEKDHHFQTIPCCNAMLEKWLDIDKTASWGKLFTAIESSAVSCSAPDKGD